MSGLAKIKVYQYKPNGSFVKMYNSISELRLKYYNGAKYPLFINDSKYSILPNGDFIFKSRVGRQAVIRYVHIDKNIFTNKRNTKLSNVKVAMYNLLYEELAVFKNASIASIITGISLNSILYMCNLTSCEHIPQNKNKIYFRFIN